MIKDINDATNIDYFITDKLENQVNVLEVFKEWPWYTRVDKEELFLMYLSQMYIFYSVTSGFTLIHSKQSIFLTALHWIWLFFHTTASAI